MLRKATFLLSGNAAHALLMLACNLLAARLIPVADYGIASTLVVAMVVVEMLSALGLQQQIVQAQEGDDPRYQAALQGFQLLRGLMAAAALVVLAVPLAGFLRIPEAAWGYMMLSAVPVLNALQHFDAHRLTRNHRFGPMILTSVVPPAVALILMWPLVLWFGDWRAVLASILLQAVLAAITSHLVAERPYRLEFDPSVMASSLRFGWPVLLNGVLLFLVFHGDKLIIGRVLGMEVLAIFAMGTTLTLTPTLVIEKSSMSFLMPSIARIDRSTDQGAKEFHRLAVLATEIHILFSVCLAVGALVLGPLLIPMILGPKYAALVSVLPFLAVLHGMRLFKAGASIVAFAIGRNTISLVANIVRVFLLPVSWVVVEHTGQLYHVIGIALLGETTGFLIALYLMRAKAGIHLRQMVAPSAASVAALLLVLLASHTGNAWISAGTVAVLPIIVMSMPETRQVFRQWRRSAWGV